MLDDLDFKEARQIEDERDSNLSTMGEAAKEFARNVEDSGSQWILTPYDTWERNPNYCGPDQPHPDADDWD